MKSWIYKALNSEVKKRTDSRDMQRGAIKTWVANIRLAFETEGAHASKAYDGVVSLIPAEDLIIDNVSNEMFELWVKVGLPAIDNTTADLQNLMAVVVFGPLIAVGKASSKQFGMFEHCPLEEVASYCKWAGSTLHNLPEVKATPLPTAVAR